MPYSPAVKESKRNEAVAEIAGLKNSARAAYEQLANVSGGLAALPTKYAGIFSPQEDAEIIADFQTAKGKVDAGLAALQAEQVDALGTDTEV